MKLETIVVATDFSPEADIAMARAIAITAANAGSVHILYVDHEVAPAPKFGGVSAETLSQVQHLIDETKAQMRSKLDAACAVAKEQGVEATGAMRVGHADEVIVAYAEEVSADLIVVGTHGRTGIKRFLLGSVAERVVRSADTNVLVAREVRSASGGFSRILVPTDFSPASRSALELAALIAAKGARVDLFHAWQYPPGTHASGLPDVDGSPIAAMRDEITGGNEKEATGWISLDDHTQLTLHFVQDFGPAGVLVQEKLEAQEYDLVAMGTHGYRGFRRFMLGSVAESTVRHAPCSVFVAHAGKPAQ